MKNKYVLKQTLSLIFIFLNLGISIAQKVIPNTIQANQNPTEVNDLLVQDCANATAQAELQVNNVRARLLAGGDFWWDANEGIYHVPKGGNGIPEVSAIFAGGLWMGGIDSGGNLKLAAQTYGSASGASDYWPGPLDDNGEVLQDQCANFDRFWQTTSGSINAHKNDWNDNGVIDGPVPGNILAWPGQGNPNFFDANGFFLPFATSGFAPFFDRNANGIYEPMSGDYPDIHEADQGIWWVFNDAGNIHTQTGGDQIHMEIQALAYAYSHSDEHINNATFYDLKLVYKSTEPIDSFYAGMWIDFDLGCSEDDYIGCDPDQNLAYVYNQDEYDGDINTGCQGVNTYTDNPPIVGVKILQGLKAIENNQEVDRGMSSFMYYNNGGSNPPPPPGTTDPASAMQYYNYLSSSWGDGTRLTQGGNGYDPASTDYTNYAYPNSPDDPNGWSMCSENDPGGDTRVIISSGPTAFQPGMVNNLCFAIVYEDNIDYPCPSLNPFHVAANTVELFYNSLTSTQEELADIPANIQFQPNPMSDYAKLIFDDLENQVQQVDVFSIDGRQVQSYGNISGSSLEIQRDNLSPGIYFYKLLTEDFKIHSGKFVVQ